MTRTQWDKKNMRTVSCRVRTDYYERLRAITEAEEISVHQLLKNLLDDFMDEYERKE